MTSPKFQPTSHRQKEEADELFDKIEIEKEALGGKVFDVLREAFDNVSLKDLLVDAIRYGEDPEIKAKMDVWKEWFLRPASGHGAMDGQREVDCEPTE